VNDEIQFGEVEQAAPNRALRPDENRHYAVGAYGEPREGELAIYVDLDVLAEMEDHALSDTAVELGGVLLGGCYEDTEGRPFVIITDTLRAQHYESTKGSFKFTHDTWAAITRERDAFPAELQMVGWYHTHPDWGVFLSGMDMFICDNFFNKKLDVAYVIDPCRGDRGMFQWTGDDRHRVRRTGGFFVTASRFRAAELEHYLAELSSAMPATSMRTLSGSSSAPVVHLHQPRDPQPPWMQIAIIGGLALQFLLVALIAWKTLASSGDAQIAAALDKLSTSMKDERKAELAEARSRARAEFLDEAFRELKGTDKGAITKLQERFDKSEERKADVAARDAYIRELNKHLDTVKDDAAHEQKRLKDANEQLTLERNRLEKRTDVLLDENDKLKEEKKANQKVAGGSARNPYVWWWVAAGALIAVALVTGVWWIGGHSEPSPSEPAEPAQKPENVSSP